MQNPLTPAGQRRAVFHFGVHAFAASLNPDDVHLFVVKEREKQAHRIRPTTNGGDDRIGQTALGSLHLFFGFFADDRLKIADHCGVRVRTGHSADAIERIAHIGHPITQRIIHRILERTTTGCHRHHLCTQ